MKNIDGPLMTGLLYWQADLSTNETTWMVKREKHSKKNQSYWQVDKKPEEPNAKVDEERGQWIIVQLIHIRVEWLHFYVI